MANNHKNNGNGKKNIRKNKHNHSFKLYSIKQGSKADSGKKTSGDIEEKKGVIEITTPDNVNITRVEENGITIPQLVVYCGSLGAHKTSIIFSQIEKDIKSIQVAQLAYNTIIADEKNASTYYDMCIKTQHPELDKSTFLNTYDDYFCRSISSLVSLINSKIIRYHTRSYVEYDSDTGGLFIKFANVA